MDNVPLPHKSRGLLILLLLGFALIVCVVWDHKRAIEAERQAAIEADRQVDLTKLNFAFSELIINTWTLDLPVCSELLLHEAEHLASSENLSVAFSKLVSPAWTLNNVQVFLESLRQEEERQVSLAKLTLEYSQVVSTAWTLKDVKVFLESLPPSELKEFGDLTGKSGATVDQLVNHLMWLSNSAFTYPLKHNNSVSYHTEILLWAAQRKRATNSVVFSSFYVERHLLQKISAEQFNQNWEHLNTQQRIELLDKLTDGGLTDSQKAALAAGTGAAALSALSATVAFSGFAFYTAMSTAIATSAGLLGVTLPFGVYAGASSTVAMLSGPIGWSIALVAGTGAAIWASAPNVEKTTKFILTLHNYKAKRAQSIAERIQELGGIVPAV